MNKINVKKLLKMNKNTNRVPLKKVEGAIISTLPSDNTKVEGRDITVFGSKKDIDLSFVKTDEGYVSNSKIVPTSFKSSDLSANLIFNENKATIKFSSASGTRRGTSISDQNRVISLATINTQGDKLNVKSKDNGLEFDISITKQRDDYSYTFDFMMNDTVSANLYSLYIHTKGLHLLVILHKE